MQRLHLSQNTQQRLKKKDYFIYCQEVKKKSIHQTNEKQRQRWKNNKLLLTSWKYN